MGVPNFMVAEATTLVTAQRLIKKNCRHCMVEHRLSNDDLLKIGVPEARLHEFQELKRGEGCQQCGDTGLQGRQAVHEVMELNAMIKEGIFRGESPLQLKRRAIESGMYTLRLSALEKLREGITCVQEVLNATVGDDV
jgi:type IV pilus assembly protein PilB